MPKTTKTTGYLVKIEAFVPAKHSDMAALADLQGMTNEMADKLAALPGCSQAVVLDITPTRR